MTMTQLSMDEEPLMDPRLLWLALLALLAALDSGAAPLALWSLGSRKEPKLARDSLSAAVALPRHAHMMRSGSAMLSPLFAAVAACKPIESLRTRWLMEIQGGSRVHTRCLGAACPYDALLQPCGISDPCS